MLDPTLAKLIEEKLPGQRFGVYCATGEGRFFPNGKEESSGYVVIGNNEHYFYWTAWDEQAQVELFGIWDLVEPETLVNHEYRNACEQAGLLNRPTI